MLTPGNKPQQDKDQSWWHILKKTASQAHDDNNRLIGSANIDNPGNHHKKTYFLYGAEHLNLENYYFDIPVVYNAKVKKWINYFLSRGRGFFERYSARGGRYAPLMGGKSSKSTDFQEI